MKFYDPLWFNLCLFTKAVNHFSSLRIVSSSFPSVLELIVAATLPQQSEIRKLNTQGLQLYKKDLFTDALFQELLFYRAFYMAVPEEKHIETWKMT